MCRPPLLLAILVAVVTTSIDAFPDEGTIFSPLFSQLCVDVDKQAGSPPGEKVQQWDCPKNEIRRNRLFRFEKVGNSYRIRPDTNRRCLGVKDASTANGADIVTQVCVDEPHQLWRVTKEGGVALTTAEETKSPADRRADGNYFEIRAMHTNQCISIAGNNKNKGTKMLQFPCKASGNNLDQLWDIQGQLGYTSLVQYQVGLNGMWSNPIPMPLVTVAAANLPDGKILCWASFLKMSFGNGNPGQTATSIFDPDTTMSSFMTIQDTGHDMFCPGTSVLFDGRVYITGGANSEKTTFYDPKTNTWSVGPELNKPRGYPGQTVLADGSVFVLGGSFTGAKGGKHGEVWDPTTNVWTNRTNIAADGDVVTDDEKKIFRADNHMWLYVAPNGLIFHAGPSKHMHWMDVSTPDGSVKPAGMRSSTDRMNGCSVMYEIGKILTFGGAVNYENAAGTTEAFIIDINQDPPVVTQTGSLTFPRVMGNAVVLPNGHVLAIGGQSFSKTFQDDLAQYRTEIWKPETGQWELLENAHVPRNYHSVALLMKNAKVFSAGGGLCGICNANHFDAEIFTPPYLIDTSTGMPKPQPMTLEAPTTIQAGSVFQVKMDTTVVHTFSLCRLGAVTHSVDNDTRRIPLTVQSQAGQFFTLVVPSNINVALAGSYFLFGMNPDGVPSIGHVLHMLPGDPTLPAIPDVVLGPFSSSSIYRINAGGISDDVEGMVWETDDTYVSGSSCNTGNFGTTLTSDIPSDAQFLHQTEVWGPCTFTMPVNPGEYRVIMHFSELYDPNQQEGARVFDVDVQNGQFTRTDIDIFKEAEGGDKVLYIIADVTVSSGEHLVVKTLKGKMENPKISALEVISKSNTPRPAMPFDPMSVVNINAGGSSGAVNGKVWETDNAYVSGIGCNIGSFGTQTSGIPSAAQFLHQKERWGPCTFTIPNLTSGNYQVILHFAELHDANKQVGARIFDISIEVDQSTFASWEDVDIFEDVGGGNIAYYLSADVNLQAGQSIVVKLKKGASKNPKISALEVVPLLDNAPSTPPDAPNPIFIGTGPIVGSFGATKRCLDQDTRGGSFQDGGRNVHQWDCHFKSNQQFELWRQQSGQYTIILQHSQFCLSVEDGDFAATSNIVQETCVDGAAHQLWTIGGSGDARDLRAGHTGYCMSLSGSNADMEKNGANVIQVPCDDPLTLRMKWKVAALDP